MAKIGFENLPGLEGRVAVKDTERVVIEAAMAKAKAEGKKAGLSEEDSVKQMRVGTIDIVRHLMAEHPDTQFVLALGGDTYLDLLGGKWKEGDTLQQLLPIVALPRAGVTAKATAENGPKLSDISSTKVRESHDLEFLASVLHPDVLKYILDHKLYAFSQPEG
jgi:nicotinic acid mononucleotide adenylyltransferase